MKGRGLLVCRCHLDLIIPIIQSMNDKALCPVVESIMSSVTGSKKSSFKQASLTSQKSKQMRCCPLFFLIRTMLVIQVGYFTSRMNPASTSLFTSFSISGTNSGRKCRWGYFFGDTPFLMDRRWTTTLGLSSGISL